MSPQPFTFGAVDTLVDLLRSAGVSASTDAGDLNLPGALIDVRSISFDLLAGYTLNTTVLLVVPDNGPARALVALSDLYNLVSTVIAPDGDVVVRTTTLAESPGPLPCLEIPCSIPSDL